MSEVTAGGGAHGPAEDGISGSAAEEAGPAAEPVRSKRAVALLAVVVALVVTVDLVTKLVAVEYLSGREPVELVPGVLELTLTRNSGAAFSIAGGATVVLSLLAIVVVAVMVRVARRLRSAGWAVALGLLGGGAVGNLIDRVFRSPGPLRGHVVDWIHLERWPVFNIADSAITIGAVVAVALSVWGIGMDGRRDREPGRRGAVVPGPPAPATTGPETTGNASAVEGEVQR